MIKKTHFKEPILKMTISSMSFGAWTKVMTVVGVISPPWKNQMRRWASVLWRLMKLHTTKTKPRKLKTKVRKNQLCMSILSQHSQLN